jgi:hypothetical protein
MNSISLFEFKNSLSALQPPAGASEHEKALWYAGRGEWDKAHLIVQDMNDQLSARIHAFLHRQEGDLSNARYWYETAGTLMPAVNLEKEWDLLVDECFS